MQKTAELDDFLDFITKNLGDERVFLVNRILRKALYKYFQELAVVVADLSAMVVKSERRFQTTNPTLRKHSSCWIYLVNVLKA